MDPLSIAIGAAIGSATSNFVGKTCDEFRGHHTSFTSTFRIDRPLSVLRPGPAQSAL